MQMNKPVNVLMNTQMNVLMNAQMNVLMNGGDELRGEHAREKGMNDIFLSIAVIPKLHKIVPYTAIIISRAAIIISRLQ